jgi:hypothetical protein
MSFLNPAFLGALALVGIPLLIHLLRRRKLKIVRWAAMEFLRQSQRKQRRRLRIEELILLLLRMLIVALAVLAFARPVLRALGVPLLSQNARVYAVLVLDNSFSMDYRSSDGKRSFERAQAAADTILTHILRSGDSASLVLLSDKPTAVVGAPSYDLNQVREQVRAAQVGDRATDYLAAAQTVVGLLKASKTPEKEVYWITDDQADAWETSKREAAHGIWGDLGKQARVTWVSVGPAANARNNLAVETPTLGRELVTPHLPARIESRVVNYGAQARRDLLVNLIVDGKQAGSTRIAVPAGGAEIARFVYLFSQPGTHTGQIALEDPEHADGLARDNVTPFVVRARDHIRVLVQDVRPTNDPLKSESFYLLAAMAPGGEAESLAPKLHEGEGLGNVNLHDYDALVLAGVTGLSSADRRALADYVKAGGGVLMFPGPDSNAPQVNAGLGAAGLLPAQLGTRKTLSEDNELTLNPATITHPALALFKDTESVNLGSARFTTYYPLEPASDDADPNAVQVMMRFSNGDPAFVERKVGLGRIILAASSAGANWNQLPLRKAWVPLIYQLLSYLGEGPTSHRNLHQDEPLFLTLPVADANKPVRVTAPDGRTTSQNSVLDARGVTFTYNATGRAGLYRVAVSGSAPDAFAVGLPSDESNLTPADPVIGAMQAGLPTGRLTVAATPEQLQASVRRSRYGMEAWRPLIWVVLVLLFVESLLAQRFGRRG